MSLRLRIAAIAGLAVALTVVGVAAGVYVAVRANLRGEIEDALVERAEAYSRAQAGQPGGPGAGPVPAPLRRPGARGGGPPGARQGGPPPYGGGPGDPPRVRARRAAPAAATRPLRRRGGRRPGHLPDRRRSATATAGDGACRSTPAPGAIAASGQGSETFGTEVGRRRTCSCSPQGLGRRGAVQVARPLTEVDDSLSGVLLAVVVIGALGVALAVLLGAVVARAALAPIGRFTRRTEAIAARPDLSERIEVEGTDELARLATSFNATLDSLEGAVDSQRRLVADASHELRTPIASLRANFETLRESERLPPEERESLRADIVEELDELTALVSDVVELARGARPEESLDDVRLDTLVGDLVERARRRGDRSLVYETELEPALVRGAPDRITRAVSNLLDNARKWSRPNGLVEVSLRDGTLTVRDHGPGFAAADLPRVFERFYRADEARGMQGSGLGLAIVKQAAETHGGRVEAANAPDGGALGAGQLRLTARPAFRHGAGRRGSEGARTGVRTSPWRPFEEGGVPPDAVRSGRPRSSTWPVAAATCSPVW